MRFQGNYFYCVGSKVVFLKVKPEGLKLSKMHEGLNYNAEIPVYSVQILGNISNCLRYGYKMLKAKFLEDSNIYTRETYVHIEIRVVFTFII